MGITWIPSSPTPGVGGSASCVSGSGYQGEWLSCDKGEAIFGEVASTHTDQVSCSVTHLCNPPAPPGMTILDTATGIIVFGTVNQILITQINTDYTLKQSHQPNQINQPTPPDNAILTHYTPLSTSYDSYTITVTAAWTHAPGGVPTTTTYVLDWKVTLYNPWRVEKQAVTNIVQ